MTALPIVIGNAAQGGTGGFTLAYPTGTLPGDLVVAYIHTCAETFTVPAAFTEAADSPQSIGTAAAAGSTRLVVAYRRAVDGDTGFAMPDSGNVNLVLLVTYRGAVETGNPFDVTAAGTEASDTSLSATGDTTTVGNCLVIVAATNATDNVAGVDQYSAWTNAALGSFAGYAFTQTAAGNGGGVNVAHGSMIAAGTFGATTATLAAASAKAFWTGALKPAAGAWLMGQGTLNGSTTGLPFAWPSGHQAGDLGVFITETANETYTAPSGWHEFPSSGQGTGTGGAAGATRIHMFWRRATSSSEANLDQSAYDPGEHQIGVLLAFRNVADTGNPYDTTSGGVKASASTSESIAGVTTTVANALLVYAITRDDDSATAHYTAWADASLTAGPYEVVDAGSTAGNGGGFGVVVGSLAAPGASGTLTATNSVSCVAAFLCIALRPATAATLIGYTFVGD